MNSNGSEDSARPNAGPLATRNGVADLCLDSPAPPRSTDPVAVAPHADKTPEAVVAALATQTHKLAGFSKTPAPTSETPELTFTVLAPLLAARRRMRVIDPRTNTSGRTRNLALRRPEWPAAVPIYDATRLTTMLVFDFDSKKHGAPAVDRDVAKVTAWLRDCGGQWISDHNPGNGGRHVIVLLAVGESYRRVNIEPVMRLLADRLPTLDLSPMLNEKTGYITPPGSATKDGGSRLLDGPLKDAVAACAARSEPGVIARLRLLLGDSLQTAHTPPSALSTPETVSADLWNGTGADARLRPEWRLRTEIPAVPLAFARHGTMPKDGRYRSRTEGCQSVLAHAALRGLSLAEVQVLVHASDADAWTGLRARYEEDEHRADAHLQHDWSRACHWTSQHIPILRSSGHGEHVVHTPPWGKSSAGRETPRTHAGLRRLLAGCKPASRDSLTGGQRWRCFRHSRMPLG